MRMTLGKLLLQRQTMMVWTSKITRLRDEAVNKFWRRKDNSGQTTF